MKCRKPVLATVLGAILAVAESRATDLDGKTRRYRGYVDMGAYESHVSPGTIMLIR